MLRWHRHTVWGGSSASTACCERRLFLEIFEVLQTYSCPKATTASCHRRHFSPEAAATSARLHYHRNFAKATGATVETCHEDFASSQEDLQHHYRAVQPPWCEDCCDTFSDITAHCQSAHASQTLSKVTCSQCKTILASQKELIEHMTTHESIEAKERRLTDLESQLAATAKAQEDQAAKLSAQQNARESKERELKLRKEAVLSQEKAALVREEKANEASIGRLQSLIDTLNAQVEVLEKEKVQLHRRNDEIDVQLGDGL